MDAKTIIALNNSITKWGKIIDGTGTDRGVDNCALCTMFYYHDCDGCPVRELTGGTMCKNSPYDQWSHHTYDCDAEEISQCDECMRLAKAELDFLILLLPEPSS